MYVYEVMRGCVCVHGSVQGVVVALLVRSGKLIIRFFFFYLVPRREDKHSYVTMFLFFLFVFLISLLPAEFAVYVDKNGKGKTLDVNTPRGLY